MAQNHIQPGNVMEYTVPNGVTITSGQLVAIGGTADDKVVGVALGSGTEGQEVRVHLSEVFEVDKTTSQTMNQGTMVYYDPTTGKATTAANTGGGSPVNHPKLGIVWRTAASAATKVQVKLLG